MVWTSANGPKCPVSPADRGEAVIDAAARIIHSGAFDREDGSEHQRHEARKKAERVLTLAHPQPQQADEPVPIARLGDAMVERVMYASQPQQADGRDLVWRIRVREGSKTYHVYTERLPFEPDADSKIVILGEPVAFAQSDGPAK